MTSVAAFLGLDYHDEAIEVNVMDHRGEILVSRRCPNSVAAVAATVPPGCRVAGAAIEACCGAADFAEELMKATGWTVDLAHPGFVARMKQNPDKHDFGDARMLADLERVGYLPRVWLAPESIRQLRRLVRYRQQLANEHRQVKLRMRAVLREERVPKPEARPWTKAWMLWLTEKAELGAQSRWVLERHLRRLEELDRELRVVERRLVLVTRDDPVVRKLQTFKGVGLITAVTLRAEIGRFDRFRTGKQLARFTGITPRNASSGKRQADAGLIKAGNPQLRAVLVETAHRLMRLEPRWIALGAAIRKRSRSGSLAAAAVANRWVRWLYHQMCTMDQAV
ncbi:MAG: IS110 family transposase [Acidobacteria bacterium]|nr:IS110 family transposase [Acidobacteriota bacterium]